MTDAREWIVLYPPAPMKLSSASATMLLLYPPAMDDLWVSTWFPKPHKTLLKFAAYEARLLTSPKTTLPTTLSTESIGSVTPIAIFQRVYLLSFIFIGELVVPTSYQSASPVELPLNTTNPVAPWGPCGHVAPVAHCGHVAPWGPCGHCIPPEKEMFLVT
jgi:hypothetical protein